MIKSIQYKFKSPNTSPGFEEGQEVCIHKGLTMYASDLKLPVFVLQMWRGEGEEACVEGYAIVDHETKQILFIDRRHDVVEYMIETLANQVEEEKEKLKKDEDDHK